MKPWRESSRGAAFQVSSLGIAFVLCAAAAQIISFSVGFKTSASSLGLFELLWSWEMEIWGRGRLWFWVFWVIGDLQEGQK